VVSNYLHEQAKVGAPISLKGPQGAYYFCSESHTEPLVLIAAGSGITPMMSTLRFLKDSGFDLPSTLIYGARTPGDVAFAAEIKSLEETLPNFRSCITLSKASPDWPGKTGRITIDLIKEMVTDLTTKRYFLCGPGDFMNSLVISLVELGVPKDRIHTEQF
jgi:ferredoxin-NADP reductase